MIRVPVATRNHLGRQENVCNWCVCVCVRARVAHHHSTLRIGVISIFFFIFNLKNNLHKSLYSTILNQDIALALTHCTEKRNLKGIQKDK